MEDRPPPLSPDHAGSTVNRRLAFLEHALAQLWPGSTTVGRRRRDAGVPYAVLPSRRRPTLVTPLSPRAATAASLRHYKAGSTARERVKWQTLGWSARLGAAWLAPDRLWVRSPGGGIDEHLARELGRDVVVGLLVGPDRANRKIVLQVLGRDGGIIGFAKVGVDPVTDDLVRRETEALLELERVPFSVLETPQVLHHGLWNEHPVLVQEPVVRGIGSGTQLLGPAMAELMDLHATDASPMRETRYWHGLDARLEALPASEMADRLRSLRDVVGRAGDSVALRSGSWHGDWTPWNMATTTDRVWVWDWERFAHPVPRGYDVLHHRLQGAVVRRRVEPLAASRAVLTEAVVLLAPHDVGAREAALTAQAYLLEIGARYLHDDVLSAGGARGDLRTWLLPALEEALDHRDGSTRR